MSHTFATMMVPAAAFPTSHPVRLTQHDIVSADYAHPVMYSITTTGCGLVAVALSVQDVMNCVPNASHARVCKQPTATMSCLYKVQPPHAYLATHASS